ncbi:DUF1259 domain-containing protein [Streptomyces sp. NPDC048275]|uniref:DUF1259 domain-containing protein n=1 Tax=Streptomyces sp. NPDC048275 TaxID=3155629 RepID=UPI0033F9536C
MDDERQQDTRSRLAASRRPVLAAAALAPVLTGVAAGARALSAGPTTTTTSPPVDLDTAAIDAAVGVKGATDGEIYKCTYVRRETVADGPVILPLGLGATTSVTFQPLGCGRAALSGDLVVIAEEVQPVLVALRRGGVELVEVHHHNLTVEPRLFYVHYWAVGDAVNLAKAIRRAVDSTNVVPMPGGAA